MSNSRIYGSHRIGKEVICYYFHLFPYTTFIDDDDREHLRFDRAPGLRC